MKMISTKKVIITLLIELMFVFCGCYTVAAKKLSKSEWRKAHSYQYFSDAQWGKQWNSYYWSPTSFGLSTKSSDSDAKKTKKTSSRSGYWENGCTDACVSSCTQGCILSFFDTIFENHDDDNDGGGNSGDEPPRRRGTENFENDTLE